MLMNANKESLAVIKTPFVSTKLAVLNANVLLALVEMVGIALVSVFIEIKRLCQLLIVIYLKHHFNIDCLILSLYFKNQCKIKRLCRNK